MEEDPQNLAHRTRGNLIVFSSPLPLPTHTETEDMLIERGFLNLTFPGPFTPYLLSPMRELNSSERSRHLILSFALVEVDPVSSDPGKWASFTCKWKWTRLLDREERKRFSSGQLRSSGLGKVGVSKTAGKVLKSDPHLGGSGMVGVPSEEHYIRLIQVRRLVGTGWQQDTWLAEVGLKKGVARAQLNYGDATATVKPNSETVGFPCLSGQTPPADAQPDFAPQLFLTTRPVRRRSGDRFVCKLWLESHHIPKSRECGCVCVCVYVGGLLCAHRNPPVLCHRRAPRRSCPVPCLFFPQTVCLRDLIFPLSSSIHPPLRRCRRQYRLGLSMWSVVRVQEVYTNHIPIHSRLCVSTCRYHVRVCANPLANMPAGDGPKIWHTCKPIVETRAAAVCFGAITSAQTLANSEQQTTLPVPLPQSVAFGRSLNGSDTEDEVRGVWR
ncbi:unnamed protein product [Protopolystoma xenopodis]|uniref:Uncharacterized protein n=1 Tax=Protopolystoma xenopodis TaxID=117903 RepID=A0A448XCQ4_9PLAT|nr:unnamed protein product [Protopolystoma xenopodis]